MKDAMATKNKSEPLVLVVDDFADAREMYGEYLKFCGFRVAEAQNGVEIGRASCRERVSDTV